MFNDGLLDISDKRAKDKLSVENLIEIAASLSMSKEDYGRFKEP